MRGWSITVVLLVLAMPAHARDIYVNNVEGDDTSNGGESVNVRTRNGPVRTLAKALRLAMPGDRIVLTNTGLPYRESVSLVGWRNGGSGVHPLVIEGNGAALDGSAPVPPDAWEHYRDAVFRFHPPQGAYQQLLYEGKPVRRVFASMTADAPPQLQPGEWALVQGWIYFCVHPRRLPDSYSLSYAEKTVGITLYHVRDVTIQNLIVQHFQLDGINAANSARELSVIGCKVRGNGRSGIVLGGDSQAKIHQCLLGNNGYAQVLTLACSQLHVHGGNLLSNTAPAWVDESGQAAWFDGLAIRGGLEEYPMPRGQ